MSLPSLNSAAPLPSSTGDDPEQSFEGTERALRVHELYLEHSSSLARQLARGTGCRELAWDVVQQTFLGLLRMRPASLGHIERPEAYLRRVSTNLVRKQGKAAALRDRVLSGLEFAAEPLLDQVALLETRDMLRRLEIAVAKLKPRTREIFLAHRLDGFTYAEIAERTGLSIKGVEKQMSKAIAKIDRLLDRD